MKTAVEWLVEQLQIFATEEEMNIIEQAKAMEKEQIKKAWQNGDGEFDYVSNELSEQYYNETFKP